MSAAALGHVESIPSGTITSDWKQAVPLLSAGPVSLREVRMADAPSLLAMLTTEEVTRFISPPPTTVEGFERFIAWCQRERAAGRGVCFGIVPAGMDAAVGIIQLRALDTSFGVAEWGFALGRIFWGTGAFRSAATVAIEFAFATLGTYRLEARACTLNLRGNGALQRLGAVKEALLRASFARNGRVYDQYLWSICAGDWRPPDRPGSPIRAH